MKYIIEHLEPRLYKWCMIEYKHISKNVGKENVIFTNLKTTNRQKKLSEFGESYKESIKELISTKFKGKRACLLDANASETLSPEDASEFEFLVFGGILGDDPPQKRTMKELGAASLPLRNLGNSQMPTDNAVYAAKKISGGTPIENIKFIDKIEIRLGKNESVIFPFRYVLEHGKPFISPELVGYLRKKKGF